MKDAREKESGEDADWSEDQFEQAGVIAPVGVNLPSRAGEEVEWGTVPFVQGEGGMRLEKGGVSGLGMKKLLERVVAKKKKQDTYSASGDYSDLADCSVVLGRDCPGFGDAWLHEPAELGCDHDEDVRERG